MGFSLRFKIIFITVAILVTAIAATTFASTYIFSQEYADVLQSRTLIIGQGIKSQLNRLLDLGIPLEDLTGFEKQMQETVQTYEGISYAMVINLDGKILFHNDPSQHNQVLTNPATLAAIKSEQNVIQGYSDQAGQFYDVFIPIFDRGDIHVGAIRLGFPAELITEKTRSLAVFSAVVALISLCTAIALLVFTLSVWVNKPLTKLLMAIQEIRSGSSGLATRVAIDSNDELGELSRAFNVMTAQLRHSIDTLEEQVSNRTRQLETVMEISRRFAVILDLEDLLRQVVILTKESFDYYHVHIYLLDANSKSLHLAEGYGQVGVEMKARGHSIGLDKPQSLEARAVRNGEIIKIDNVQEMEGWLPDPLLPDTRSEIAVPIILEDEVVGVLDVQQNEIAGLDDNDANLLRLLANQIAIAIRNARLFEETEEALTDARTAQERYLEQAWQKVGLTTPGNQYLYQESQKAQLDEAHQQIFIEARQEALATTQPTVISLGANGSEQKALVAPIQLRDKTIGDLQLYTAKTWTEDDLIIVEAILDRLAQRAENLRLFEETREQASFERLVGDISQKIRQAPNLELLAKTAAEELARVLDTSHSLVRLGTASERASLSKEIPAPQSQSEGGQ